MNKTVRMLGIAFSATVLGGVLLPALPVAADAAVCSLRPVKIAPEQINVFKTYRARGERYELVFKDTSGAGQDAFPEPLDVIEIRSGKRCEYSGSVVTQAYFSTNERAVLLVGYSGSETYLEWIDPTTCKKVRELLHYTSEVTIESRRIIVKPACEPYANKGSCDSGGIYTLNPQCLPELLFSETSSAARKAIGVSFVGHAEVLEPGTPRAKLAPAVLVRDGGSPSKDDG
jgi:hypothetical protein